MRLPASARALFETATGRRRGNRAPAGPWAGSWFQEGQRVPDFGCRLPALTPPSTCVQPCHFQHGNAGFGRAHLIPKAWRAEGSRTRSDCL